MFQPTANQTSVTTTPASAPAVAAPTTLATPATSQNSFREQKEIIDGQFKDAKLNKTAKQIIPFETEALRLKQKCKDLKQKISDIEAQNQTRTIGVSRAKDSISRLRFEYSLLLEFLEKKSETLGYPDLKSFTTNDINADAIESLSLEDITRLLNNTPLALSSIKHLVPNALGDLIADRQQEFLNHSSSSEQTVVTNGKNRRGKRGISNGAPTSSRKRIRDPREPKRPTNAYLFFCDAERDRVKAEWAKEHPDEHIDLSRAMTDVWRTMSNEDKKPYFDLYEKDKERYHKAVKEFATIKEQEKLAAAQSSAGASAEPEMEAEVDTPASVTTVGENTPLPEDFDDDGEDGDDEDPDTSIPGGDITHNADLEDLEDDDEEEEDLDDEDEDRDMSKISIKQELTDNYDAFNSEIPEEEEEEIEEEDEDDGEDIEDENEEEEENIHQSADFTDGIQEEDDRAETPLLKSEPDETSFNEGASEL